MADKQPRKSSDKARVLVFSHKNIYEPEVWRCSFHEFEELLQQIDSVDTLAPRPGKWFEFRRNNAQRVGKYTPFPINPGIPKIKLDREYDLFLAVCEKPSELLNINVIEGWKECCKTSICWLAELWAKDIPSYRAPIKVLSKFDHVMFNVAGSIEPISRRIPSQCHYLPAGIDTTVFNPYPDMPKRFVDVLSIGRRSEKTHQVLLRMAQDKKIFYFYDTQNDLHTYDIGQHRFLMANMAKRSRYFIVNPGKIDSPDDTGGQVEFGYRYFEGAASGTIMIGEDPQTDEFRKYFHWPDAVIHIPFDSEEIDKTIQELDRQPERQEKIRRNNVVQSLLHHDWVYRWETVLKIAELEPMPELLKRKQRLEKLSDMVDTESTDT